MRKAKETVFSLPDPVECLLCCLSVSNALIHSAMQRLTLYVYSFSSSQITSKAFTTVDRFRIILTLRLLYGQKMLIKVYED